MLSKYLVAYSFCRRSFKLYVCVGREGGGGEGGERIREGKGVMITNCDY